ncbi:MAG: hypothetical protein FWJ72_16645, partial [Acidimicrobiia bacterium]
MTVTAVPCDRDGCSGTVVDGYCDTCGMAPRAAAGTSAPAAGGAGPAADRRGQRGPGRVAG